MKLHRMFPPRWAGFITAGWMLSLAIGMAAAGFKAGVARAPITPDLPCWLSGFAARTHPAVEVAMPLWAKALALEDRQGRQAVFVSTDLIGLPGALSDAVAARVHREFGIERARLVLNSTHTHSGPAVHPNLSVMFDWGPEDQRRAEEYANELTERLVRVVGDALRDLAPAELDTGHGRATFAMNRRQFVANGIRNGLNPSGPFDHDYALRIKRSYPRENMVVAGYSHDVMGYIPSQRILREGGYEAVESMIYYGQPGPFQPDVEERVMRGVDQVLREAGAAKPR